MGFTVFRAIATILICALLLLLFVLPSQYLDRLANEADALIETAQDALYRNDLNAAHACCRSLVALSETHMPALERFLNHSNVDTLAGSFAVAEAAVRVGDAGAALEALAEARTMLIRLRGIEHFSFNNLL